MRRGRFSRPGLLLHFSLLLRFALFAEGVLGRSLGWSSLTRNTDFYIVVVLVSVNTACDFSLLLYLLVFQGCELWLIVGVSSIECFGVFYL